MNVVKIPRSILKRETNHSLLPAILDDLPSLNRYNGWIAGGAIRDHFLGNPIKDYDFFFKSSEDAVRFIEDANNKIKLSRENLINSTKFNYTYKVNFKDKDIIIQVIHGISYPSISSMFDFFDFTICCWAADSSYLYFTPEAFADSISKSLVPIKITHAISSFRRLLKYQKKGYKVCNGTISSFLTLVTANPTSINSNVISLD